MSEPAAVDLSPLDPAVREQLCQVTTASLTSGLLKRGFRSRFMLGVAPLRPDLKLVGLARTLRYVPMREDLGQIEPFRSAVSQQRQAVEQVGPGEVLVIDARGERTAGTSPRGHPATSSSPACRCAARPAWSPTAASEIPLPSPPWTGAHLARTVRTASRCRAESGFQQFHADSSRRVRPCG